MIAVDTNVLVHAHRADSPWHEAASARLRELAESALPWAVPWPCLHEFLATVTHPRIFRTPTPLEKALAQVDLWIESPALEVLGEGPSYWPTLRDQLAAGSVVGPLVHDARIAAICIEHAVDELWTADRDFSRFPRLRTRNPLLGK